MPAKKGKKLSRTTARAIAVDMKKAQALELRMQGWTYKVIAEELKIATSRAHQLVDAALREHIHDPIEKLRSLAVHRAEAVMSQIFPLVAAGDQMAITNWLAVEARLDKLYGIVAPADQVVDLNVSGGLAHEIRVTFVTPPPQPDPMLIEAKAVNGKGNGHGNGNGHG